MRLSLEIQSTLASNHSLSIPSHLLLSLLIPMLLLASTPAWSWEEEDSPQPARVTIPTLGEDASCPESGYTSEPYDLGPDVPMDPPLDISEGCPTWRWLAIQADPWTPCPVPEPAPTGEEWKIEPLFGGPIDDLPAALKPFCLYETQSASAVTRQQFNDSVASLKDSGALARIESSCGAVSPAAAVSTAGEVAARDGQVGADSLGGIDGPSKQVDPLWDLLERHFYDHTQPLPEIMVDTPMGASRLSEYPRTRLAVIDTEPRRPPDPFLLDPADPDGGVQDEFAYSPHGLALLRIAERLVCQNGEAGYCAAEVVPELGLPIVDLVADDPTKTDIDWWNGGHLGTIDHIAQAVWRAVEAWQDSPQQHLVLNLSLGWVGENFGGLESDPNEWFISIRSLYEALRVASCEGALTVAASGNKVGGPQTETGPLLPGAWERLAAPTPGECRELLARGHEDKEPPRGWFADLRGKWCPEMMDEEPDMAPEPLLYAAGGVHADGTTLVNARPESEPARVAFADHAVVPGSRGDTYWPTVLTGSSVAAVDFSAAVAAVWHFLPELTRTEVVELVETSGKSLDRTADVFFGPSPGVVHQIAVCPAVKNALERRCRGGRDPMGRPCATLECPETPEGPSFLDIEQGCSQTIELDLSANTEMSQQDFCERPVQYAPTKQGPPQNPCPFRQFWGVCARPWVCPQPDGDPCPTCPLSGGGGGGARLAGLTGTGDTIDDTAADHDHFQSLRIQIDPNWPAEIYSATLGIGDRRYALAINWDFTKTDEGSRDPSDRCVIVTGVPKLDGERAAIYFHSTKGPWESVIFEPR